MRGASKALCIITGIIDVFLALGTVIFLIVVLVGGFSAIFSETGGGNGSSSMMMIAAFFLCGLGFIISVIAAVCAFNAAGGKRGACIATIVFGFMGENIFAVIGGILGAIAYKNEN